MVYQNHGVTHMLVYTSHSVKYSSYYGPGDHIIIKLNFCNKKITFGKNAEYFRVAFTDLNVPVKVAVAFLVKTHQQHLLISVMT